MPAYRTYWNYELNINSIITITEAIITAFLNMTPESEFHGEGRVLSFSFGGMDIFKP